MTFRGPFGNIIPMKSEENMDNETQEPRLYELGYHVIPTVAEEAVAEEVVRVRDVVESHTGTITTDEMPAMRELAYPITKVFANKRKQFESAYFGWMGFMATPKGVIAIKESLDANESILRFIIVKTTQTKEAPDSSKKMAFIKKEDEVKTEKAQKEKVAPKTKISPVKEEKKEISEAELDKTIEDLIVE